MKIRNWLLPLTLTLTLTSSAVAQTATDSAQNLRDSVQKKVEEELSQIRQAVSKKAFLGSIASKNEAVLNLITYRNESRQAIVAADSAIKLKTGRDGTPADLAVGDYILVMGEVDSQNQMTAKRLLVVPAPPEENRRVTAGQVADIGSGSVTLTPVSGQPVTATLQAASAVYRIETGTPVKAKTSDIIPGSQVVMIVRSSASATIVTDLLITSGPAPTPASKISP